VAIESDPIYIQGRSESETQRLILQALIYDANTRRFLQDAGLTTGMKVLDVGSGARDVAFLAARLVGPTGSVVGVDQNSEVLETARERARAARLAHVTFVEGDIRAADLPNDFDAAIGRLVLMYTTDPAQALKAAVNHVQPGGIVAFQEVEVPLLLQYAESVQMPVFREIVRCLVELFRHGGVPLSTGFGLHQVFLAAGLPAPTMSTYSPMGGPPEWPGYRGMVETMRSVLPLLEHFEITTAEKLDLDTLADGLLAEVESAGTPMAGATHVGAWARGRVSRCRERRQRQGPVAITPTIGTNGPTPCVIIRALCRADGHTGHPHGSGAESDSAARL